jgi:hypothetical protein
MQTIGTLEGFGNVFGQAAAKRQQQMAMKLKLLSAAKPENKALAAYAGLYDMKANKRAQNATRRTNQFKDALGVAALATGGILAAGALSTGAAAGAVGAAAPGAGAVGAGAAGAALPAATTGVATTAATASGGGFFSTLGTGLGSALTSSATNLIGNMFGQKQGAGDMFSGMTGGVTDRGTIPVGFDPASQGSVISPNDIQGPAVQMVAGPDGTFQLAPVVEQQPASGIDIAGMSPAVKIGAAAAIGYVLYSYLNTKHKRKGNRK